MPVFQSDLTRGRVSRTLLRFALPFLAAQFLQALYGAADLLIVGQFSDAASLAAVAVGSQMMQTITSLVLGFAGGGTVLIGQAAGARDSGRQARIVGTLFWVFLLIALGLSALVLPLHRQLIVIMETPAEAVPAAQEYLLICGMGLLFIVGYNVVSAILRGLGDSRTPLLFILVACLCNIVGDLLLVGVLRLGAAGAAAATVTAQGLSFLMSLLFLRRRGFPFPFRRRDLRLHGDLARQTLALGAPLAMQEGLVGVSFLLITVIINTMGLIASASMGVVERIIGFAMLPPSAFSAAVAAMTSQNIGARRPDRARRCMSRGILFSLAFGLTITVYCQFFPESLTALFSGDPEVVSVAGDYLRSFSLDCTLVCFVFCMSSYFTGCGKTVFNLIQSVLCTFGVRIPVTLLLSRMEGVTMYHLGFAAPLASVLGICLCLGYLVWKKPGWQAGPANPAQGDGISGENGGF